jgi:hypothetical protein
LLSYLTQRFPGSCGPDNWESPRKTIQEGIKWAKVRGITSEYDIARFIKLMFLFPQDFDSSPDTSWAAPIVDNPDLTPGEKMDQLYERTDMKNHELQSEMGRV